MDVVMLSRLQFGAAAFFHFLFVPLTLGLSVLLAIMETIYVRTGNEEYKRMAKFWGKLFIINFAIGVVTGLTLEFQFGTNWSKYSAFVGDIFGSLLAIEATVTFFLESTFLAVWIFGWNRVSPKLHAVSIWLVAIASTLSAYWIIAANAWMQHPVGYVIRNGRAELVNFYEVVTQWFAVVSFVHVVNGAYILGGFFVAGVSAYHIMRKNEVGFFRKSFKLGVWFALIFALLEIVQGHMNGAVVAKYQPAKLAAMESFWETKTHAPQMMFIIPDEKNERNLVEFGEIPGMLSLLAFHDMAAEVKGLKEFPVEERPPVLPTFLSFRIMMGLGFLFPAIAALGVLLSMKAERFESGLFSPLKRIRTMFDERPRLWWAFILAIPLPYIALQTGWALSEIGRQPWIVYEVMKTSDGVSPVSVQQVTTSLVGFFLVYGVLGVVDFYLLYKFSKKGPVPAESGGKEAGHA